MLMTEFELKLEIPDARREEVVAAFGKARSQRLRARYFDTADGHLARAGIVVRVRKEGSHWVQTGKAAGDSALRRLEHNVALPLVPASEAPAVDLSRHDHTPLGGRIRKALGLRSRDRNSDEHGDGFPPLVAVFETNVLRRTRIAKSGDSVVEIALDQGVVLAGERHLPLYELEFELKDGRPEDAVRLARTWCVRHGLFLSSISKSQKGKRLAAQAGNTATVPPRATKAKPAQFPRDSAGPAVLAAVVHACLEQILPNASDVASGSDDAEVIHQLRVGIRRLRTALRELDGLADGIDPQWEKPWVKVFRALGEHRDSGFLAHTLQPQLEAVGGPALPVLADAKPADPVAAVRSAAFQGAMMDLLAFAHGTPASANDVEPKALVRARLQKLWRQLLKDGRGYTSLDEEAQHRVRKRLKRLRYVGELAVPLFASGKVEHFLAELKDAQDALGQYNDELMALQHYSMLSTSDPRAWFGVGWLGARRAANAAACQQDLIALAKTKPYWKK